jgi:hypothetical protein
MSLMDRIERCLAAQLLYETACSRCDLDAISCDSGEPYGPCKQCVQQGKRCDLLERKQAWDALHRLARAAVHLCKAAGVAWTWLLDEYADGRLPEGPLHDLVALFHEVDALADALNLPIPDFSRYA